MSDAPAKNSLIFPLMVVIAILALAVIMMLREPDLAWMFGLAAIFLPACWVLIETLRFTYPLSETALEERDLIRRSIGLAALMIAVALGMTVIYTSGFAWITDQFEQRSTGIVFAMLLVVVGNILPKTPVPLSDDPNASIKRQAQMRSTGLFMVITGLIYGLVWVLAPLDLATPLSMGALVSGVALMMLRLVMVARFKAGPNS